MTKLIVAFRNFTEAPKNVYSLTHSLQLSGDNGLQNVTVNTDIFTVNLSVLIFIVAPCIL